jgi:hypothetical protein
MTEMIHGMDSKPGMSSHAYQMAQQHKQKFLSMQRKLSKEKLIMRASYKGYSFRAYLAQEFEQKASNYIQKTGIYNFINVINPFNPKVSQKYLSNVIERVNTILNNLLRCKSITDAQHILIQPKRSIVRLNYLYFVPDTYQVCFSFIFCNLFSVLYNYKNNFCFPGTENHFNPLSFAIMDQLCTLLII